MPAYMSESSVYLVEALDSWEQLNADENRSAYRSSDDPFEEIVQTQPIELDRELLSKWVCEKVGELDIHQVAEQVQEHHQLKAGQRRR
jgi:hypothetical protein